MSYAGVRRVFGSATETIEAVEGGRKPGWDLFATPGLVDEVADFYAETRRGESGRQARHLDPRRRVLQPAHGRLRAQVAPALRHPPHRELERRGEHP